MAKPTPERVQFELNRLQAEMIAFEAQTGHPVTHVKIASEGYFEMLPE